MKKVFILVLVLVVVALGIYFYNKNEVKAPVVETNEPQTTQYATTTGVSPNGQTTVKGSTGPDYTPTSTPKAKAGGGETPAPNIQVVEVDFDGTAFSPKTVTINQNDWVFFKNKSTVAFWPASDPHPTHTNYPGFDALKSIAPGGEYKFQFTKVGTWGYHDHLDHGITGTVIVK